MARSISPISKVILLGLALCPIVSLAIGVPRNIYTSEVLARAADVKPEYDYIIVGGGTAGLTVADRLTENGKCKWRLCISLYV